MIENSLAETKWCPFALVQSEEKLCGVSGDALGGFSGNNVAVTVINRTANGEKHPDCLCITDRCVWWRTHNGTKGDCSKLNDNMNPMVDEPDNVMAQLHCPHARPENATVTRPWNGTISGCDVTVSSANRVAGNQMHPSSKCITNQCMAYSARPTNPVLGYCMSADKNMQR